MDQCTTGEQETQGGGEVLMPEAMSPAAVGCSAWPSPHALPNALADERPGVIGRPGTVFVGRERWW
jgi:hypothetical protein